MLDPEIVTGNRKDQEFVYDNSNDVYGLGVILYYMFNKQTYPFDSVFYEEFIRAVAVGKFYAFEGVDEDIIHIAQLCLQRWKAKRISLANLKARVLEAMKVTNPKISTHDFYLSNKSTDFVKYSNNNMEFLDFLEIYQSKIIFASIIVFLVFPILFYLIKNSVGDSKNEEESGDVLYP